MHLRMKDSLLLFMIEYCIVHMSHCTFILSPKVVNVSMAYLHHS